ncbi:MAG: SDR family NAD(P)-dependent oxidoreductase, partial [Frateuria sp.]|nr:SDR family NAD(P)-dependent oxidoreductase [Frateuria sp.]
MASWKATAWRSPAWCLATCSLPSAWSCCCSPSRPSCWGCPSASVPRSSTDMPGGAAFDFRGYRVVVAGGSKGIGRAIALAFAQAGAMVSVCARGAPALEATRKAL